MARLLRVLLVVCAAIGLAGCASAVESVSSEGPPAETSTTSSTTTIAETTGPRTEMDDPAIQVRTECRPPDEPALPDDGSPPPTTTTPQPICETVVEQVDDPESEEPRLGNRRDRFDQLPTLDQVNVVVAEEIILDLNSGVASRFGAGAWTPEQIEPTSQCFADSLLSRWPDTDIQELLETTWNGNSPLNRVTRDVSKEDQAMDLVHCIDSPQQFVSIYTGQWLKPESQECLAEGLTVEQRTQLLLASNRGFNEFWLPLLTDCGWIGGVDELPAIAFR